MHTTFDESWLPSTGNFIVIPDEVQEDLNLLTDDKLFDAVALIQDLNDHLGLVLETSIPFIPNRNMYIVGLGSISMVIQVSPEVCMIVSLVKNDQ